jgi:hypothetical protein
MTITTTGISPVIIGRNGSSGEAAEIAAGSNGTALALVSDNSVVRDIRVAGGSGSAAKGVVVRGVGAKVTLRRVTVALGAGLGISADAGAVLTMDRCVVQNNSGGGVTVNGATYNIQNSVIADNAIGVQFLAPVAAGSVFAFNTIKETFAVNCGSGDVHTVKDSIVSGMKVGCTVTNSVTTAPMFSETKPFHLTAHLACPAAPATFPAYDIDGDPRVAPTIDCGADQYVP